MADQRTTSSSDVASSGRTTPVGTTPPPEAQRAAKSTPIARKIAGYSLYASAFKNEDMASKYVELAKETRGHYIGPMPVQTFLDDFLPWNDETPEAFREARISPQRFTKLKSVGAAKEAQSYKRYIESFTGWTKFAASKAVGIKPSSYIKCPLEFRDTHLHRDTSCGSLGMDITVYGKTRFRRTKSRIMDFANAEVSIELKPRADSDAFVDPLVESAEDDTEDEVSEESDLVDEDVQERVDYDSEDEADDDDPTDEGGDDVARETKENVELPEEPPAEPAETVPPIVNTHYPFENASKLGVSTRGQLAAYNAVILAVQYRSHVFSTLICGEYARLIRWDRSAAVVTRRFDYTEKAGATILFRFYQRFAQLTDEQRGFDSSITTPSKKEGKLAREAFTRYASELWKGQTQSFLKKQESTSQLSLLKMTFAEETYIIAAPVYHEGFLSPFCRSTRRCTIMRLHDKAVFFFKDYWREDSPITLKESEIYERLAQHQIENVAEMAAGGDVDHLKTIGHRYASADWVSRATPLTIRQLHSHRIILVTIGRDLSTFPTAKSLVKCVADAMKAHQMAYQKARILHRDISVGNILMKLRLTDDSPICGFLIDWDHCVVLDLIPADASYEHRISRTGTWQFIAAHLAEDPFTEHTVLDDRESALYVLAYVAFRHLQHNLDSQQLAQVLEVFDEYVTHTGRPDKGGARKIDALQSGRFARVKFDVPGLARLFRYLSKVFAARYPLQDEDSGDDQYFSGESEDKAKEEKMLKLLNDGSWLYTTLAEAADRLPEPEKDQLDWVDNTKVTNTFPKANNKRPGEPLELETNEVRMFKKSKGFDGQASRVHTSELL